MTMSSIMARIVALIGAVALQWRRLQDVAPQPAWGSAPVVPVAKPQGTLPTLKMPTARGWSDGQKPVAAPGLKVNAFATGLKHPRWIHVLPNGDVLVAESNQVAGPIRSVFSYAMQATMRRARALGESANRITLFRDTDGDETPPDYLTSVRDGGFYGWPFCYWGQTVDDRVPQDAAMVAKAITPDYALGGHTASLGLCWVPAGTLPGFPDGMAIGQHGSWNRSTLSGYKLVFVPFENGRPSGPARDILSGFLAPDEKESYGRPVGVMVGPDGRSLLMADDVGDVIWRVTGA